MKRYQVYLNSQSVELIDTLEQEGILSRSHIIRLAIDSVAQNLAHLALPPKKITGALDDLVGLINLKTKHTNISGKVDDIYLTD